MDLGPLIHAVVLLAIGYFVGKHVRTEEFMKSNSIEVQGKWYLVVDVERYNELVAFRDEELKRRHDLAKNPPLDEKTKQALLRVIKTLEPCERKLKGAALAHLQASIAAMETAVEDNTEAPLEGAGESLAQAHTLVDPFDEEHEWTLLGEQLQRLQRIIASI